MKTPFLPRGRSGAKSDKCKMQNAKVKMEDKTLQQKPASQFCNLKFAFCTLHWLRLKAAL
jgi:hypothetical protein